MATELSGEEVQKCGDRVIGRGYSVVQEIRIARVVATRGQRFITANDM